MRRREKEGARNIIDKRGAQREAGLLQGRGQFGVQEPKCGAKMYKNKI